MKKSKKKSDAENHLADLPPPVAVEELKGPGSIYFKTRAEAV
jgi:hypothetical protein